MQPLILAFIIITFSLQLINLYWNIRRHREKKDKIKPSVPSRNISKCIQITNLDEWNAHAANIEGLEPVEINSDVQNYVSPKGRYWETGQTIKIAWVGGNSAQWDFVKRHAERWLQYANLKFEWAVPVSQSDIRIGFNNTGAWSWVGRPSLSIGTQQTMNFGWLTIDTVIHEFGHMLNLLHGHQHPDRPDLKHDVIYQETSQPPNGWNKAITDSNIILKHSRATNDIGQYIPTVMDYDLFARWCVDGIARIAPKTITQPLILWTQKFYPKSDDNPVVVTPIDPPTETNCDELQSELNECNRQLNLKNSAFTKIKTLLIEYRRDGEKTEDVQELILSLYEECNL